ncbi:hypothetical protein DPMN_025827 [Dreissena polymorpha]|uniref:Uncharacterized protein n=1 Tax=Dreissena polymorpha TaxID=45954 RepID=A0A9D4LPZ2_DREPO|nr:hypothetical protein DPMN_025827 [Dreissena polymorpha]
MKLFFCFFRRSGTSIRRARRSSREESRGRASQADRTEIWTSGVVGSSSRAISLTRLKFCFSVAARTS